MNKINDTIRKFERYLDQDSQNDHFGQSFARLCSQILSEVKTIDNEVHLQLLDLLSGLYVFNLSLMLRQEFYISDKPDETYFNFAPPADPRKATEYYAGMRFEGVPYLMLDTQYGDPRDLLRRSIKSGSLFGEDNPYEIFIRNDKTLAILIKDLFRKLSASGECLIPEENEHLSLTLFRIQEELQMKSIWSLYPQVTRPLILFCIMSKEPGIFWESADSCLLYSFYLESTDYQKEIIREFEKRPLPDPISKCIELIPCEPGIIGLGDIPVALEVEASHRFQSDGGLPLSAARLFRGSYSDCDVEDIIKSSMNYFGEQLDQYPGVLLSLYRASGKLKPVAFDRIFKSKTNDQIRDLELYLSLYKENVSTELMSQYVLLNKEYLDNPDYPEKKNRLLMGFLFFTIWDLSKKITPSKELTKRQDLLNLLYKSAEEGHYDSPEVLSEIMNLLSSQIYPRKDLDFTPEFFQGLDNNLLSDLTLHLRDSPSGHHDGLLKEMTAIADIQKRYLPTIFDQRKIFSKEMYANDEVRKIEGNRKALEQLDSGFLAPMGQTPIPCSPCFIYREVFVKFFADSDKEYISAVSEQRKKQRKAVYVIKPGTENFRKTNRNNLSHYYLFASERNTRYHSALHHSITKLLDDNHPENLLHALYDVNEYFQDYYNDLEGKHVQEEQLAVLFIKEKFDGIFKDIGRMLFPEKKSINWKDLFNQHGELNISAELFDQLNYSDHDFSEKVISFFKIAYLLEDDWLDTAGLPITVYLLYLRLNIHRAVLFSSE